VASDKNRKCGGKLTEPDFPPRTIAREGKISIENFYRSQGDHGPPHLHVIQENLNVAIGQNGKPLENYPELTKAQQEVVERNRNVIKKAIRQIGRWYWYHNLADKELDNG
jgi:hypothetical protein